MAVTPRSRDPRESAGLPAPRRTAERDLDELREQTDVGAVFLGALMRRQFRLSLGIACVFLVILGLQPVLPSIWPDYVDMSVAGLPLPWLVLGGASYPLLVALGAIYVRRAEAIDDDFTDLLG